VCHLVLQVLPEAHALGVHANAQEEEPGAAYEVGQRLVGDDALRHSVTQRHRLRLLVVTCTKKMTQNDMLCHRPTTEAGQRLVGNDALRHSVTQRHRLRLLVVTCTKK
jgi:hypothetical protein